MLLEECQHVCPVCVCVCVLPRVRRSARPAMFGILKGTDLTSPPAGGAARTRGRGAPSAEAGGAETGPPAKMVDAAQPSTRRRWRRWPRVGEAMSQVARLKAFGRARGGGGDGGEVGSGWYGAVRRACRREVGVNSEGACP